jgi:hypothetical protein
MAAAWPSSPQQGSPLFELRLRFNAGACQDGDTPALRRLRCIRSIKASKAWTPKASRLGSAASAQACNETSATTMRESA